MAAYSQPFPILLSILLSIPKSASQQNIQTFYPFSTPPVFRPPPPVDDLPDIPPATAISRPSPPGKPSTRAAVGKAIGVTAASTLVISGLLFCVVLMYSNRKKEKLAAATSATADTAAASAAANREINVSTFNGNLKGIIVDENGLDVLYWRNLEDEEKMTSFKKQYYKLKNEEKEQKINVVNGNVRKVEQSVQEVPLLRGNSSTSQIPDWGEKDNVFSSATPADVTPEKDQASFSCVPETSPPPRMQPVLAASRSVLKGKMPAPETESSSVVNRISNRLDSSAGQILAPPEMMIGESSNGSGPVTLKPNEDSTDEDSFKFEGDLMEALFGSVATNRKSLRIEVESTPPMADDADMNMMEALFGYVATNRKSSKTGSLSSPPSKVVILETRKSQGTAMAIESLGVTHREIANALLNGKGLSAKTMKKVAKIAPTDEEITKILAFKGDSSTLADAESFLYQLLKAVPTAFTRLNAMLAKSSLESDISGIKQASNSLESACNEIKAPGLFLKLLEAVHKAGNRLSVEIRSRGDEQAFNLMFLRKLADVRSTDGKTTLLQFIIREVTRAEGKRCVLDRNRHLSSRKTDAILSEDGREREYMMLGLPVIGGLSAGFSNVAKSAALDYNVFAGTASSLAGKVAESRKTVARCGRDGGFCREMMNFLDGAELELEMIQEEQRRVVEIVKERSDFYQVGFPGDDGSGKIHLFVVVQDFLGMIDQICVEIARNSQKTRPALPSAAGTSPGISHESARVFRFPLLPADFMSEFTERRSGNEDHGQKK